MKLVPRKKNYVAHNEILIEKGFPCLMKRPINGNFVVLFNAPKRGIVVSSGGMGYPVGTYRTDWVNDGWEPYSGTIEIEG